MSGQGRGEKPTTANHARTNKRRHPSQLVSSSRRKIPEMPLDPDSSSSPPPPPAPAQHRDWFFPPAPPFLPSSRARTPRTPFPSTYRSSKPYSVYSLPDRRPPPTPRSRSRSPHPPPEQQQQHQAPPPPPPSAPRRRDPRYAGVRRDDDRTAASDEKAAPPTPAPVHGRKPPASPVTTRWSGVLSAAVRKERGGGGVNFAGFSVL
jgi:hypothetical protein